MTITTTPIEDYEVLTAAGDVLRTVQGKATAIMLCNSGEAASYRPVQNRIRLDIAPGTTVAELVEFAANHQAAEDEPSAPFEPTDTEFHEINTATFDERAESIEATRHADQVFGGIPRHNWEKVERDIADPAAEEQAVYFPWKQVERDVDVVELNNQFAVVDLEPVKPDWSSKKIGDLRKAASQKGMRAATGVDPHKSANKNQLIEFLEGSNHG